MFNGLWLNRGLSFRFGHQFSREVGVSWVVHPQKKAFESQVKLIKHIEDKYDINIDVNIDTFTTQYDNLFFKYFHELATDYNFIKVMDPGNHFSFNRALFRIADKLEKYDFLVVSRNDMIFKDDFLDKINPFDQEIKYAFDMLDDLEIPDHSKNKSKKYINRVPRICDTIFFVPKKYYDRLDIFKLSHGDNHDYLLNIVINKPDTDISPYIETLHDSDPHKYWNPLYKIVGRSEKEKNN